MNRKLLNGLLVLTVATGGVVTFTSCKDEDYLNNIAFEEEMDELIDTPSSIEIDQTYNPMFGSFNLPIGLKTTMVATYVVNGAGATGYNFPEMGYNHIASGSPIDANDDALDVVSSLSKSVSVPINAGAYTTAAGYGNFGSIYTTINPSKVDFSQAAYTADLVDATGNTVNLNLTIAKNTDQLAFGVTREATPANNNVYKVNVNLADNTPFSGYTMDLDNLKDYEQDLKDAWDNKTLSNLAYLGELVYTKLNGKIPAYALRLSWLEEEATLTNSASSAHDIAAAVVHPLSYETLYDQKLGSKRFPTTSPLNDILTEIQNKLDIDNVKVDGVEATLEFTIEVKDGMVYITYVTSDGESVTAEFEYDGTINVDDETLTSFVQAVIDAENKALDGTLLAALYQAIDNINAQLDTYKAKVDKFFDWVQGRDEYHYAARLLEIYNQLAGKINRFLDNPNHYFQVMALYSNPQGHYHRLSTNADDPTVVDLTSGGDMFELFLTSYTGDVVVPSYYKYIALTAVNGTAATTAQNDNAELNIILPGQRHRAAVKVDSFSNGDVLRLTYLSVDYHGLVSAQNFYVKIMK